jgi:hypothetical protein
MITSHFCGDRTVATPKGHAPLSIIGEKPYITTQSRFGSAFFPKQ